ncbi:MAG: FxsA family protein [Paracoccaceae bacterium]
MPIVVGLLIWPLIEIALFVTLGGWLGLWATLAIVLGTAVAGVFLMRWRGLRAVADLRAQVSNMRNPLPDVADQAMFMLAGLLLILPGFLTDIFGLLLLLPPVRYALVALAAQRMVIHGGPGAQGAPQRDQDDVIDGEFRPVDENTDRLRKPSGWTQD